ncbi:MAG: hypothetical protein IPN03_07665 [Holophagales bacterium]|nr:hypothetical protein [Holophagales bacterium]
MKGATTAFSTNVASLLGELDDDAYHVPDYQRDSSQWDLSKKSLFIDSLINNDRAAPDPLSGDE